MILSYLLAFSLLIMSVIKVTDIFIKSDLDLNTKRIEFIKETKKTHQKGSITLMGILLTLMISALLLFFALKFKVELKEARYRKESYLCFTYLNVETQNYVSDMTKLNWAIRSAYFATISIIFTAEALPLFDSLKLARDMRHLYYLKTLLSNNYCKNPLSSYSYFMNPPYKMNVARMLETNIDGTTIIREAKWTVTYYKNPKGIRLKKSFCLKADMEIESAFFPKFKIKTSEISMADFSKLKCLSGFL